MNHAQKRRTALVTGASRGLGAAIAEALAADGMRVAINYVASAAAAEAVCERIHIRGGEAQAFQADVRNETEVERLVGEVAAVFGEIEVLVLNATGPQPQLAIEQQSWQSYLDQMEFFVKSPLLLTKQVLPGMKLRRFGRIVQIGSEVFELGNARFANYVAAKGAQLGQTRSWASELGPHGITVNLVAPGWIPTERYTEANDAEMTAYVAGVPMQHVGTPEDVGRMVAFLAGDEAGFITGQKIAVNGAKTFG